MPSPKYLYIVECVGFDSYERHGIFTNKKLAEECAAQHNGEQYSWENTRITRIKVRDKLEFPKGYRSYSILMDHAGMVLEIFQVPARRENFQHNSLNGETIEGKYVVKYDGTVYFNVGTVGGREKAIQIANKKRLKMIKNNTWPKSGEVVKDSI